MLPNLGSYFDDGFTQNASDYAAHISHVQSNAPNSSFFNTRLSPHDCVFEFGSQYTTVYQDVLVIVGTVDNSTGSVLRAFISVVPEQCSPPGWMCDDCGYSSCYLSTLGSNPWYIDYSYSFPSESSGAEVKYCLAHKVPEKCAVQFSRSIMIVVIVCNAAKLFCFLMCLRMDVIDPFGTFRTHLSSKSLHANTSLEQ